MRINNKQHVCGIIECFGVYSTKIACAQDGGVGNKTSSRLGDNTRSVFGSGILLDKEITVYLYHMKVQHDIDIRQYELFKSRASTFEYVSGILVMPRHIYAL